MDGAVSIAGDSRDRTGKADRRVDVFVARRGDVRPKTNVAPKSVHALFFLVVGDNTSSSI